MDRPIREKIARFISEFKDWDGAREYIKEGWLYKADIIIANITEELKKQIDIKRDYAFGESAFGSREKKDGMLAMVGAYDVVLKLIKDIGGKE